jgi:hypothetical protein
MHSDYGDMPVERWRPLESWTVYLRVSRFLPGFGLSFLSMDAIGDEVISFSWTGTRLIARCGSVLSAEAIRIVYSYIRGFTQDHASERFRRLY